MDQPRGSDNEPPQEPPDGSDPSLDSHYASNSFDGEGRSRSQRRTHIDDLKDFRVETPRV